MGNEDRGRADEKRETIKVEYADGTTQEFPLRDGQLVKVVTPIGAMGYWDQTLGTPQPT